MSEIQKSASILAKTLEGKNKDYAPEDEFSNFNRAAAFVGGGMDNLAVMLTQIAIKFTRLETLIRYDGMTEPNYESIADTLLDLAGYSVIAHAYLNSRDGRVRSYTSEGHTSTLDR